MGCCLIHTLLRPRKLQLTIRATLGALMILIAMLRLHTWGEPPETDLSTYWVAANEMIRGKVLYKEVWDIKPPAVYATFAVAASLTRDPCFARYLLWTTASALTLLGVFNLGKLLTGSAVAGLIAASFWSIVANDCWLEANQPNTEVFINAATVWALVLFVTSERKRFSLARAFGAGILLGIASLYKTVALAFVPFFCAVALARTHHLISSSNSPWRRAAAIPITVLAGVIGTWVIVFAVFSKRAALADLTATLLWWGSAYAQDVVGNLLAGLHITRIVHPGSQNIMPTMLLAAVGLFAVLRRASAPSAWWVIAWLLGVFIAYAAPGRFYRHYYQLWLPPFCVLCSFAYAGCPRLSHGDTKKRRFAIAALLFSTQVLLQASFYARPALDWSRVKYGDTFIKERDVGLIAGRTIAPHEFLYVWGTAPTIYEAAQRRPGSGIFFAIPLLWGPTTATLSWRVLADLEQTQPELLILDFKNVPAPAGHPVVEWLATNYTRHHALPVLPEPFVMFCRKGGRLAMRLNSGTQTHSETSTTLCGNVP